MSGCEEVREILVATARGETVSIPGQRFLREHADACPHCRRRLANERMLSAGLAAMSSSTAGAPPAAVKAALLAEFRRQQVVVPVRRPILQWVAVAAVAAALLLAFLLTRGHRQQPVVAPPHVNVAIAPAPAPDVVPAAVPDPPRVQHVARRGTATRPPAVKPPAPKAQDPAEVATDFLEIPYVEPLRPDQRADVFRMQVPRASMAVFGLPVTGGRLDSRITADVLMGEDGVARAVRFIR